jgi:hypothetical protein
MIINAFTIILLFIAVISVILGIVTLFSALVLFRKWKKGMTNEERTRLENKAYLTLLLAVVLLGIRIIDWPIFYATLASYIPDITGAMCIYGVTQVAPKIIKPMEVLKPFVFFLIGLWLIIYIMDKSAKTYPLMRRKLFFLFIVSIFAIADSIGDIAVAFSMDVNTVVSCCTTVFDIADRPSAMLPQSIIGAGYKKLILPMYYGSNLILIGYMAAGCGLGWLKVEKKRRIYLFAGGILSVITVVIALLSMMEVIAPRLLNLPYHHDPYDLLTELPDAGIFFGLFIIGIFSTGWAYGIDVLARHDETKGILSENIKKIYWFGIVCLLASLLMITIHLIIG